MFDASRCFDLLAVGVRESQCDVCEEELFACIALLVNHLGACFPCILAAEVILLG